MRRATPLDGPDPGSTPGAHDPAPSAEEPAPWSGAVAPLSQLFLELAGCAPERPAPRAPGAGPPPEDGSAP